MNENVRILCYADGEGGCDDSLPTDDGRCDDCCSECCLGAQCRRTATTCSSLSHLTRYTECRSLAALANHKLKTRERKSNIGTIITRTKVALTDTPYIALNRKVKYTVINICANPDGRSADESRRRT